MEFTELNLQGDLQRGITEAGYLSCTPVQEQVLKNAFNGQDLYVQSQTGTGKTAAFLIVIFQRLLTEPLLNGKKALIMAPTRELAVQIETEAKALGAYLPFETGSFYGGVGYGPQQAMLRADVQIMVGTPGRVLDLNQSGQMNLMEIGFLILDEADRMFDMGFYPDLRKLIRVVPPADRRQTMLFSATLNARVKNLAWEYTKEPFEIEIVASSVTVDAVEQILYHVPSSDKMKLLLGILAREQPESAIIFCNTKRYTEIIAERLRANGFQCEFIIGDLPQSRRLAIIEDVKAGIIRYLVATDVAARGLDIEGLAMVVNYDLPSEAENYVHRIGRTARAGKSGKAVSLASEQDVYELADIEKYIEWKIPSEVAGEHLYAEDKSSGRRSNARGGARSDGRPPVFERPRKRPEHGAPERAGKEQGRPSDTRKPKERGENEPKRTRRRGRPPVPEKNSADLSQLSFEDRMAYYKEKYHAEDGRAAGKVTVPASVAQTPKSDKPPRRRRRRGDQPDARRVPPEASSYPVPPAAIEAPLPISAPPPLPVKKGLFSRIFDLFKKEDDS
jgi:ATP-dependent RNA helicase RhlB